MDNLNSENLGVGVDIEQIERFIKPVDEKDERFLGRIFTRAEIEYCFAHGKPYQHLAVRYAGKEAVVKALSQLKMEGAVYSDIEILNNDEGVPDVVIRKEGFGGLIIKLSLSHSEQSAIAFALVVRK